MADVIQNLIMFRDSMQRTLIGEKVPEKSTDKILAVKNPVLVNFTKQGGNGEVGIQLLPTIFREFIADKVADLTEFFNMDSVVRIEIESPFDIKLYAQYRHLSKPIPQQQVQPIPQAPQPLPNQPVIKLFDDEEKA